MQITLFRGGPDAGDLIRDGVDSTAAQVGVKQVFVAITSRADCNLDYAVDAADATVIQANWLQASGATLRTGDVTNDGAVDLQDANALTGLWPETVDGTPSASGRYDPATGHVFIIAEGVEFLRITSATDALTGTPAWDGLSPVASAHGASESGAFSETSWLVVEYDLGAIAAVGLTQGDLMLTYNYHGSVEPDGFTVPVVIDATEVVVDEQFNHAEPDPAPPSRAAAAAFAAFPPHRRRRGHRLLQARAAAGRRVRHRPGGRQPRPAPHP